MDDAMFVIERECGQGGMILGCATSFESARDYIRSLEPSAEEEGCIGRKTWFFRGAPDPFNDDEVPYYYVRSIPIV